MPNYINCPNINKFLGSGIIRATPTLGKTSTNKEVLNFFIANTRQFKHSVTGEEIEKTVFISISCWGKLGETWKNTLKKGHFVYIEGALQSRSWVDKNNNKQNIIEINAERIHLMDTGEKNDN